MFEFSFLETGFSDLVLLGSRLDSVRLYSLVLGIGTLAGGVLLLLNHKRQLDEVLGSRPESRIADFEQRKYRRRASASTMIACLGCLLAGLYWVTDEKVFAIFILMILTLLVGIFGLAIFDLFSVGLHHIATPDQKEQKKLIQEYLREREKLLNKVAATESVTGPDAESESASESG